ncbi:BREX-2 system adenine-specific DNA-methyltransferase PglX [Nocardioides dubius]|uniref:site-specific DNA-methyltransferase (adenine-specific) n=1 Tax=Nocardioides dubius TaxID=317019 RepID=A0ABP4E6D8_9ACTN
MIQSAALLKDLKAQLKLVQADLRARADDTSDRWGARLQEEYAEARKRERTGHSWVVWRDNEVDQAAVAWLISMTFVRFCEDNDLLSGARIDGQPVPIGWIAGPGDRTARAEENLTAYFRENPTHNRRDWLRQAFRVLAAQPAGKALVDEKHNPVWTADISAERASELIDFWRQTDSSGVLVHDFSDANLDTRFLGDLYQDLSEHARKTYALLQTPVFVEEFILDQTLTPALEEFGLDGLKLIDPTCGSGHFLLGAFERLVTQWQADAPALDAKEHVRRAMDSIHGVDLNPFAVAIARFRLTVAGLLAMGERSLVGVSNLGFHLAIGDSLLGETGGAPQALQFDGEETETYFYDGEDLKEYAGILQPGQYHVVVGNPPYITVKDKALNALYRRSYSTAARKYALSAPFMELFFRLAIKGEQNRGAGYTGQITANSFMKREFGKKLIEEFLAGFHLGNPVDLLTVVDSSGAYIPGHGTPTVIIVGRRRRPVDEQVRAVLGIRGEPGQPADPATGQVWTEIVSHLDQPGFNGKFVSVVDLERSILSSHPWSLGGGGAAELRELLEEAGARKLGSVMAEAGFSDITGNDDVFLMPERVAVTKKIASQCRPFVEGDVVRDYRFDARSVAFLPTSESGSPLEPLPAAFQHVWPFRKLLQSAVFFGKTPDQRGLRWYDHAIFQPGKHSNDLLLTYSFVSTHNHFALERGGNLFNKSAPVIKLPATATEDDHLALIGLLNSSTACFWMKQVSHNKGDSTDTKGARVTGDPAFDSYEFTGTKMEQFPLPRALPLVRGRRLDSLAHTMHRTAPAYRVATWLRSGAGEALSASLEEARREWNLVRQQMIFEQEELDWEVYRLFGLIDEVVEATGRDKDMLHLGGRAFEIALARRLEAGEVQTAWFRRTGSEPTTVVSQEWPTGYADLVEKRLALIEENPVLRLLEGPEFKRRWSAPTWEAQIESAVKDAILDRLEPVGLWRDGQGPLARSVAELADAVKGDSILRELVEVLTGDSEADLTKVVGSLVTAEAVPYLAAHRYKGAGLEKFRTWQQVWDLQRREDAGEKVDIPVPPKYSTPDFRRPEYWKARGKLDVPKERFILYPGLGREGDSTVVLGWAGWDYRDQALALAREFPVQDALGAEDDLLTQMVAGLVELEPWVYQWHSEIDASFGVSPADAISGIIDHQLGRLEATREEVTEWVPPAPTRGRRAKKS